MAGEAMEKDRGEAVEGAESGAVRSRGRPKAPAEVVDEEGDGLPPGTPDAVRVKIDELMALHIRLTTDSEAAIKAPLNRRNLEGEGPEGVERRQATADRRPAVVTEAGTRWRADAIRYETERRELEKSGIDVERIVRFRFLRPIVQPGDSFEEIEDVEEEEGE